MNSRLLIRLVAGSLLAFVAARAGAATEGGEGGRDCAKRVEAGTRSEAASMLARGADELARGELLRASDALEQALERARAADARDLEAAALLEQGNLLRARGEAAAALAAFRDSQRLAQASGAQVLALQAGASGVRAALEADRLDGLREQIHELLQQTRALDASLPRAHLQIHLARSASLLAARLPRFRNDLLRTAATALEHAVESARAGGDARLRSYALGQLAELYEARGRQKEALELTRRALFAAQLADAPEAVYRWQAQLGRIARSAGQDDEALSAYRQTVATLGALREDLALASKASAAKFRAEVEPIYMGLVDLLLEKAARSGQDAQRQALLAEVRESLEALKAEELRDYFDDPCLAEREVTALDELPGALVVYPIVLPDRTELIVGRAGRLESYVSRVSAERLVAEVRAFRRNLEKRTTRQYLRESRNLYDWLIAPFEPLLRAGPVNALVFVPGGALRTIPFAALQDRESGEYLIEKVAVAVTPSLALSDPRPIDRAAIQSLVAGLSDSVQGYPALAAVRDEVDDVSDSFPGRQLLNEDFRIERFGREIKGRRFGIVHIATHGEFSADVSESYLLAYDGKLSMDRLSAMIASTQLRGQAVELLTLSGCQTAAGDDRAALGLAGVAVRAGARSAIATLWSVNDEATAELIAEFYGQLSKPGRSRAEALRQAQLELLRTPYYQHPSFWAPFLLINGWL